MSVIGHDLTSMGLPRGLSSSLCECGAGPSYAPGAAKKRESEYLRRSQGYSPTTILA